MKPGTVKLLSALCATSSKRTIVDLWSDNKNLSKADFEQALAIIQRQLDTIAVNTPPPPVPAPTARRRRSVPRDDKPTTRIVHILQTQLALSDRDAAEALSRTLRQSDVSAARIPPITSSGFEVWLDKLLGQVSASVVLDAAIRAEEAGKR